MIKPILSLSLASLLVLAAPAHADSEFGNQFLVGSPPVSLVVDSKTEQWACSTVIKDTRVIAIQVLLTSATTEALTLELHNDSTTDEPLAAVTLESPQTGWNRIEIPPTPVETDDILYLLLNVPGSGQVEWTMINIANHGTQPSGAEDPALAHGSKTTSVKRSMPVYILETEAAHSNFGMPYYLRGNTSVLGGFNLPAQHFVFQPPFNGGSQIDQVSLVLSVRQGEIPDQCTLALLDENNTVLESFKVQADDLMAGPPRMHTFLVEWETALIPGKAYSLVFFSDSPEGKISWLSAATDNESARNLATWQGEQGFASGFADSSFQEQTQPDLAKDYIFRFDLR